MASTKPVEVELSGSAPQACTGTRGVIGRVPGFGHIGAECRCQFPKKSFAGGAASKVDGQRHSQLGIRQRGPNPEDRIQAQRADAPPPISTMTAETRRWSTLVQTGGGIKNGRGSRSPWRRSGEFPSGNAFRFRRFALRPRVRVLGCGPQRRGCWMLQWRDESRPKAFTHRRAPLRRTVFRLFYWFRGAIERARASRQSSYAPRGHRPPCA